jgi:hypothetical protein
LRELPVICGDPAEADHEPFIGHTGRVAGRYFLSISRSVRRK